MRPALVLALLSPALAEIGSTNTPILAFLRPGFVCAMVIAYSLPVVAIREVKQRRGLSIAGVFLLGLAYGIFNEGVIAKTLTQLTEGPAVPFNGYPRVGGIGLGWAVFILPWHSFHSVVFPIAITEHLFRGRAGEPWILVRAARIFAGITLAATVLYFAPPFTPGKFEPASATVYLIYLAAAAICGAIALRMRGDDKGRAQRFRAAALGFAVAFSYVGQYLLAQNRAPFVVLLAFVAAVLAMQIRYLRAGERVVPYAIGGYVGFIGFASLSSIANGRFPLQVAGALVLFCAFFVFVFRRTESA